MLLKLKTTKLNRKLKFKEDESEAISSEAPTSKDENIVSLASVSDLSYFPIKKGNFNEEKLTSTMKHFILLNGACQPKEYLLTHMGEEASKFYTERSKSGIISYALCQWYSIGGTRRHLRGYIKFQISIYILFHE
jgi:hypothetical protein